MACEHFPIDADKKLTSNVCGACCFAAGRLAGIEEAKVCDDFRSDYGTHAVAMILSRTVRLLAQPAGAAAPEPTIVGRRVVSAPGAAVAETVLELSDSEPEGLSGFGKLVAAYRGVRASVDERYVEIGRFPITSVTPDDDRLPATVLLPARNAMCATCGYYGVDPVFPCPECGCPAMHVAASEPRSEAAECTCAYEQRIEQMADGCAFTSTERLTNGQCVVHGKPGAR